MHRQHSPSGPIVGQSEQSARDDSRWPVRADVSRWCYSPNSPSHGLCRHPCNTIQGSAWCLSFMTVQALREVSVFAQAVLLLPCWTNNHYPRPGLNVVIKPYKMALLPTASTDKAFLVIVMQFSLGKMIKWRQNSITLYPIDRTGYHFRNRWA